MRQEASERVVGESPLFSAVSQYIGGQFGDGLEFNLDGFKAIGSHALLGGAISAANGGDFASGALSGALGKAASIGAGQGLYSKLGIDGGDFSDIVARTTMAAIVGGTVSKLSGGNFANGARTAVMQHLFNYETTAHKKNITCSGQGCKKYLSNSKYKVTRARPRPIAEQNEMIGNVGLIVAGGLLCVWSGCTGNAAYIAWTSAGLGVDQVVSMADDTSLITSGLEDLGMSPDNAVLMRDSAAVAVNVIYPVKRAAGIASAIQSGKTVPMSGLDKVSDHVWAASSSVAAGSLMND